MRTSAIVDALRAMVGRRAGGAAVTDEVMELIDPFGVERNRVKVEAASRNNTEGPSVLQADLETSSMTATTATDEALIHRPKRADARRNYDKLIEAARAAFTELGSSASLEEIARRADVGIGTLYRHFPTRHDLLQAVYVEEVEALAASVADFSDLSPWDALVAWMRRFVAYAQAKRALAEELLAVMGMDSPLFRQCHDAIWKVGEPLLARAQEDGSVRPDTDFGDVVRMVSGISMVKYAEPDQLDRILLVALDGLRYRA